MFVAKQIMVNVVVVEPGLNTPRITLDRHIG